MFFIIIFKWHLIALPQFNSHEAQLTYRMTFRRPSENKYNLCVVDMHDADSDMNWSPAFQSY